MGLGAPMAWLSSLLGTDVDRHRQMGQTLAVDYLSDPGVTAEHSSFHLCLSCSKIRDVAFNFD